MVRSFYTDTVTRLRATVVTDDRNNSAPDWSVAVASSLVITGCRVQPVSSEEFMENRSGSRVDYRLLTPPGSDITFLDRVTFSGLTFEVVGDPRAHRSPSGVASHDEVLLRRMTG